MTEQIVTVAARIQAKPEKLDEVKLTLLDMAQLTHAEEGCMAFDLHPSLDDSCQFRLSEMWVNKQALDAHLEKPYISK